MYLRKSKNFRKEAKKNGSPQIGCVENAIFATERDENCN